MGRKRRDVSAGTHHLTLHAIEGAPLFADTYDFNERLDILADACGGDDFSINLFCLMDNHEHLVATVSADVLPKVMRNMNRSYAGKFNERHGRKGHVYGDPYFSVRITSEGHALNVVRYVALNPDGSRYTAESYPFSSYRSLVRNNDEFPFVDPTPILEWFGGGDRARALVAAFVEDGRIMRRAA
jgi:putative transposase